MDLHKYEEALDSISEKIVSRFFENDYSKYNKGKSTLFERFTENKYEDIFDSLPYFLPYLRKHFLYFCQNAPGLVGHILYSISKESISDIMDYLKPSAKIYFPSSKRKIVDAENSYHVIRNKLLKILDSPKTSKKDIKNILNLIEPISNLIYYSDARVVYVMLFTEIKYSLQLLYYTEDISEMIYPHRNLILQYGDILNDLGALTKLDYTKYTFITMLIEDLEIIYNRIEEFHSKPEPQDGVSDSGSVTTKPTSVDKAVGLLKHIEGLTWDEITITLISLDSIRITARDFKQTFHFSELGMKDQRSSEKADSNWRLISLFALKNGTVTFTEIEETRYYSEPKKAISILQKKLKQLIGLQDNPIENYKSRVGYKAKFYIKHEIPSQFHGSAQQDDAIEELKW